MKILTNDKEFNVQPQADGFIRCVPLYNPISDTWDLSVENPIEVAIPVVTNPHARMDAPALPPFFESVTVLTGLTEEEANTAVNIAMLTVGLSFTAVNLTGCLEETHESLLTIWKARFEKEGQTPKLTRLFLNFIFCAILGMSGGMTIRNFLDNDWANLNLTVLCSSAIILQALNRNYRLEDKLTISNLEAWRLQTKVMQLESTNNDNERN